MDDPALNASTPSVNDRHDSEPAADCLEPLRHDIGNVARRKTVQIELVLEWKLDRFVLILTHRPMRIPRRRMSEASGMFVASGGSGDMSTLSDDLARVRSFRYDAEDIAQIEALHEEIRALRRERNAVIVAHNYYRPEILKVADFVGDSLELSIMAAEVRDADVIVFCGVHFMAETAKIVNPSRTVLLPNTLAGCQLADSAPAEDVKAKIDELRTIHPDLAVVSYVNTTAAVKALSDVCCTSSNAPRVVRALPNQHILFLPDRNLAGYVADQVPEKTIIPWEGFCYVHQQITPGEISRIREADPSLKILVHPECRKDVAKLADAVLSTSGMVRYAREHDDERYLVVTECGLTDRLAMEVPDKTFVKGCKVCAFMKVTTLEDVRDSLRDLKYPVEIPEPIREKAELALRRMFAIEEQR